MNFSEALVALSRGERVATAEMARAGWYLFQASPADPIRTRGPANEDNMYLPSSSGSDLIATDWQIVKQDSAAAPAEPEAAYIGRPVVLVTPGAEKPVTAAIVTDIGEGNVVSLVCFSANGVTFSLAAVPFIGADDTPTGRGWRFK